MPTYLLFERDRLDPIARLDDRCFGPGGFIATSRFPNLAICSALLRGDKTVQLSVERFSAIGMTWNPT